MLILAEKNAPPPPTMKVSLVPSPALFLLGLSSKGSWREEVIPPMLKAETKVKRKDLQIQRDKCTAS